MVRFILSVLALVSSEPVDLASQNHHVRFAPSHFSTLTAEQFRKVVGKPEPRERAQLFTQDFASSALVNETIDWQMMGATTAVKDQHLGQGYGTCWSFATSGTMEGQESVASGHPPLDLSPQMLIDCCPECFGHPDVSMNWLLLVGGQDTQKSYGPYQGKTGICNNESATVGQSISAVHAIDEGEDKFMAMLQHGPFHVAIDCTSLQDYEQGILTNASCEDPGNHDVLLVGAGEENGTKYWKIKNSWGDWFGEDGYFRAERGSNQLCLGLKNRWGSAGTMVTGKATPSAVV